MVHSALDVCPPSGQDNIHFNKAYLTSIAAINKAVEFMLFMFSFALASNFKARLTSYEELTGGSFPHGRVDLHIFVMALSWLGVIILLVAYAFNIVTIISSKYKYTFAVMAIVHASGALVMLIVTSITLDNVLDLRKKSKSNNLCVLLACSSYEGAGATGFFAIISVTFDAVLHGIKAIQVYRDNQPDEEENAGSPDGQGERNESYEPQEAEISGVWDVKDDNISSPNDVEVKYHAENS